METALAGRLHHHEHTAPEFLQLGVVEDRAFLGTNPRCRSGGTHLPFYLSGTAPPIILVISSAARFTFGPSSEIT